METQEALQLIRDSEEYQIQFRIPVLKRDEGLCQICTETQDPHVHHIKSFYFYPKLRLDPDNGLTLCARCHAIIHGYEYDGLIEPIDGRIADACEDEYLAGMKKALGDPVGAVSQVCWEERRRARREALKESRS